MFIMKIILALLFLMIACASSMAQQSNALFLKIENSIRENEPNWTLMNAWPGPEGQAIGYRWKLDQHEIFVMVIRERSTAEAVKCFQDDGLGQLPGRSAPLKLDIGDECYLSRSGPHTAIVIRKDDLLVRLGSDSSGPEWLSRFARHIGNALGEGTRSIKAAESFKEPLRLRPDRAQAHYDLGRSYYETGDYKAAATSLEEALRLQPDFFEALVLLAKSYQHAGLYASAVSVLQKAVLLQPTNLDVRTSLGTALILAGQPQDAITVLEEVARLSPASALVYTHLGQAYRLTGKFQEALNAFTQALRINPQDPVVHNWLGLTYESLEREQEALAAYKRAIELKPDYAEAHYNLGMLYLMLGDRTQAEQEYSILKNLNSDLAQVLSTKLRQPDPL
jgi:tetratricopeptide (TPR) repeat protein